MRTFGVPDISFLRIALGVALAMTALVRPCPALDKPTGDPLVRSSIETEQPVPLAFLDPDGKTAHCAIVKLHWNPNPNVGPEDEATSFALDIAPENPSAAIFTAQLWSASLASALAWQEPWQGARWKIIQTPTTDGTGIDAALAVGMISTSARRTYPEKTVVIGSLNPDGSLGPVSHLIERMNAAAAAGMTRVIIPGVQRFDTDASGQVVNMVRHANDLHLECVPVDNLVDATQTTMNDPLPDTTPASSAPKYNDEVASYIDDFAHREENEAESNLKFAPKEADLSHYPPRLAALWKSAYADVVTGQQAYRAGQVYVAYRSFCHANAGMLGVSALVGQNRASFDVKSALSESDDLRNHLHALMNPPACDKDELQSSVLVAEMADWAYEIDASLQGAQLVTKQTFSQRTDATDAQKDRAREAILYSIEQGKYLLNQASFFNGLLPHLVKDNAITVDENAAHLLPQLIPAQLATARIFTDGIRDRANELRDGLLFDPRLVAYVSVLIEIKTDWDARQRKKEIDAQSAAANPPTPGPTNGTPAKPDSKSTTPVAFDPGNTYAPPHTALAPTLAAKKLSDGALCLIWVNHDCEIATLDEKYLRLSGVVDPATHEWHVKDRAKLEALLQSAEIGARQGIAFAEKAEIDSSVLAMIYERAAHLRIQDDDTSALEALRNYWRCALLGNMCWQLAHTHKAQPVDLSNGPTPPAAAKPGKTEDKPKEPTATASNKPSAPVNSNPPPAASTNAVAGTKPPVVPVVPVAPIAPVVHLPVVNPTPAPVEPTVVAVNPQAIPVAPIAHGVTEPPRALPVVIDPVPVVNQAPTPVVPVAPVATPAGDNNEPNIPTAPIAKLEDYGPAGAPPSTNAPPTAPVIGPIPPSTKPDHSDGQAFP